MKKNLIILGCIIGMLLIVGMTFLLKFLNNEKVREFSLNDYTYAIQDFSSDKTLGEIPTSKAARKKAESIWIETFGETIKNEKPYKVLFDKNRNVWLVTGSLHKSLFSNTTGGVAYLLVQKSDGKVLALWHEK